MLSLSAVTSPTKAAAYFEADNYYAKNDPEAKSMSAWFGKGAETLGLNGEVDPQAFVALLHGKMPNGEQLGRLKEGKHEHRPGYDLTFSAPKSVSILLEIGEDTRLLTAHTKAVDTVLAQIEKDLASCRVTHQGKTKIEKTDNLLVAKFIHDTSRALDPQLHTHAIVMNATIGQDGKIRSLASQSQQQVSKEGKQGFMEKLYHNKLYYGALYRSQLAFEVKNLGYEINQTHRDGRFEIAGVPETVIQHFSKRRQDIESSLELEGRAGAKDSAKATLFTRPDKQNIDRSMLDSHWKEEAKGLGFDAIKAVEQSQQQLKEAEISPSPTLQKDSYQSPSSSLDRELDEVQTKGQQSWLTTTLDWISRHFTQGLSAKTNLNQPLGHNNQAMLSKEERAQEAVVYAMAHLSERSSAFDRKELLQVAMTHALGIVSPEGLNIAIEEAKSRGILIERTIQEDTWLTTDLSIHLEKEILATFDKGKDSVTPLLSVPKTEQALKDFGLSPEQYQAGLLMLTARDRVVGIQGYAGTGKTSSLRATQEVMKEVVLENISLIQKILGASSKAIEIRGMAPSASAAKALAQSAGIPSQTLASFIYEKEREVSQTQDRPSLWILDEASMVSSRQMLTLLNLAEQKNAHLILVGDTKQLLAVEAGQPFAQLQQQGMQTAQITAIKRQTNPILLSSVQDSIQGQITSALTKVNAIHAYTELDTRLAKIAEAYLSLSPDGRKETLVITPRRENRLKVNESIRKGLIEEGSLGTKSQTTLILSQDNFTEVEKGRASNFNEGQILVFHQPYQGKGSAFRYWEVAKVDKANQTLLLKHWGTDKESILALGKDAGEQVKSFDVYQRENRELRTGDLIRWTKNNKSQGMINGDMATVVKIGKHQATFKLSNQDRLKLDLRQHQNKHWEYAYANTVYAAQGQTATRVLAHEESYTRLTHQRAFYVILSRARESVTLFLDNVDRYREKLQEATGNRLNALDLLKGKEEPKALNEVKNEAPPSLKKTALSSPLMPHPTLTILPKELVNPSIEKPKVLRFDKEEVRQMAQQNLPFIVEKLLGQPNERLSKGREWRYGKKGSLSIQMEGKNKGMWHDFEGSAGKISGDVFSLVEREMMVNFKTAVETLGQWLGLSPKERDFSTQKESETLTLLKAKERTLHLPNPEDKARIKLAQDKFNLATGLANTLAEKYLKNHRGINLEKLPDSLAFLSAKFNKIDNKFYPALIAKAENQKGEIEAVQLIYLNNKTGQKADIPTNKRQFGRMKFGAYVTLQDGDNKRIMIAEGIETGLSIAEANPGQKVIASLSISNLKNLVLPGDNKEVVLCADNDKGREFALKQLAPAIELFQGQGKTVYLAFPEWPKGMEKDQEQSKVDFNDVHRKVGLEAVKRQSNQLEKLEPIQAKTIDSLNPSSKEKAVLEPFTPTPKEANPMAILFPENIPNIPLPERQKNTPNLDL